MELIFIILSITSVQIPALILRYLPFSRLLTHAKKKKLFLYYSLCFISQDILLYFLLNNRYTNMTPLSYKRLIFLGSLFYLSINFIVIKGFFFQHMFIFGMQGGYCLLLHSFVAILLGLYGKNLTLANQFLIQTGIFILLFTIITIPLWKHIKSSFIFKSSVKEDYYWYIIWLIPILAVYSDVIVTMNHQWINTWQQFASRLMTGFALFITWKFINLDFKALDEIFYLKNTNKLLHLQNESIHNQAQTLQKNDRKIRILKHDMRHHLLLLSSLLENKNFSEATLLISQLGDSLQSTKPILFCKNPVINSALLVYITKAQENNIEIISEIDIPENIPWNNNDLAILFANALENAVLASMKQTEDNKKIHITTRYAENKLAIIIKNRFDGKILFNDKRLPIPNVLDHGVGMISIISIVTKYHGQVSCSHKEGWFSISFLFSERLIEKNDSIY